MIITIYKIRQTKITNSMYGYYVKILPEGFETYDEAYEFINSITVKKRDNTCILHEVIETRKIILSK